MVCATSGETDYFECLLRMRDEDGARIPCGEFIAAAEETGLIGLIDRHVLNLAFDELAGDRALGCGFNVSARTACDRPWLRSLIALVRHRPEFSRATARHRDHRDRSALIISASWCALSTRFACRLPRRTRRIPAPGTRLCVICRHWT